MVHSNNVTQLRILDFICQRCEALNLCPANILSADERKKFSSATIHNERLDCGEHLFCPGDRLHHIYIIHSGSFKTYVTNASGIAQITGLYSQGDVLGFNSIGHVIENHGAVALESAIVCKVSITEYKKIEAQYPALSWAFLKSMCRDIMLKQKMLFVLGKMNSEQKIAYFLIHISRLSGLQDSSPAVFNLFMKRSDIANYLGMAVETVSRVFTEFKNAGVISVERRKVSILDFDALYALCQGNDTETAVKYLLQRKRQVLT